MKRFFAVLAFLLLSVSLLKAGDMKPRKPGPKDKCPVCGMFVAKYPDFVSQIIFKDGACAFFDGVKDMMKYLFNLKKYGQGKKEDDIVSIYVTDYYSLESIDGLEAFYVSGSDVYGPMGKELIPFEQESEAQEFLKDHKGRKIWRFKEIDETMIKGLD